ncbi:MAG: cellulase family glycosylhydrolase [Melioribacter sp.]|nr:cellulase family glycosylhydrolase [Melioribacter sp.]
MKSAKKILLLFLIVSTIIYSQQSSKKVAFFIADNFPAIDVPVIVNSELEKLAANYNYQILKSVESLNNNLNTTNFSLLVLPYGSAFPLDAWQTILNFLNSGGSIINIGGSPFYQPVLWQDSVWTLGIPQQTFARKLMIGPADKIELQSNRFYSPVKTIAMNNFLFDENELKNLTTVYELTYRFTIQKDFAVEDGSSGPRDAIIRPLAHMINKSNYPFAAPIIEIDRLQGSNAGGRWIFSTSNAQHSVTLIKKLIDRALQGALELTANPIFASIHNNEIPLIRINLFQPSNTSNKPVKISVTLRNEKNKVLLTKKYELTGTNDFKTATISLEGRYSTGFYSVDVEAENINQQNNKIVTGFWVRDKNPLFNSPQIIVSKDWLRKDGKVFPVIGTTYMASDVHRKFLFEPNPYVWKNDFEMMKRSGINFIRTGLWNSWSRIMLDRGAVDESFLRALDAFVMTAIKNEIVVCFNFFAFTPPLNGGTNPYLDPSALDWQKTLITLITTRYKDIGWVHYDLINEPSYSPPNDIWKNSPIGDSYEKAEWQKWINKKYNLTATGLQNKWRDAIGDIYSPPSESELSYRIYKEDRRPRKAIDFNLFTQDVVTNWADTLTRTIKSVSNTLVTLGQDEGGTSTRPSQQFHYTAVDYTSIHTWWLNDDLLWDGLITKVPEKPNLISETGLMRLEDIDGEPWRSPSIARNLLDRKFGLGFASRGAGIVQWAWNINPYMPIDNESAIGFFRPDGTAKLEIETLGKYSKFFEAANTIIEDYEPAEVVVVIPNTKIFAGRKNADLSTKRLVRTITDHLGITPSLISEYKLTSVRLANAKLVIIPSAEFINDEAAKVLYNASLNGTKVLFTGSLEGNSYGEISESISRLGLINKSTPVSYYEKYVIHNNQSNAETIATFDNQQSEFIKKCIADNLYSNNNIYHEPLPLELAKEKELLIDLLKYMLGKSLIEYYYDETPLSTNILPMKNHFLVVLVNESSADLTKILRLGSISISTKVKTGQSKLLIVNRQSGTVISETD